MFAVTVTSSNPLILSVAWKRFHGRLAKYGAVGYCRVVQLTPRPHIHLLVAVDAGTTTTALRESVTRAGFGPCRDVSPVTSPHAVATYNVKRLRDDYRRFPDARKLITYGRNWKSIPNPSQTEARDDA